MRKKETHNLQVYAQDNSGSRVKPRSGDLAGLVAEDGIIALLMKNPDYYKDIKDKLYSDDFKDEDNRVIYSEISERLDKDLDCGLTYLSGKLTNTQMSKLSGLLAKNRDINFSKDQTFEYLAAVKAQKSKKSAEEQREMPAGELLKYALEQRNKFN